MKEDEAPLAITTTEFWNAIENAKRGGARAEAQLASERLAKAVAFARKQELEFNIKELRKQLQNAPIAFLEQKDGGVQIGFQMVIIELEKRLGVLK